MRERDVEDYLVRRVKEKGGEVRKVKWVGRRGAPDRVVFLNGVHFVELKRPGARLADHQEREHARMQKHGAKVWTLDSIVAIDMFMVTFGHV